MHGFIPGVIDAAGNGKRESSDSSMILFEEALKQKYEELYLLLFYGILILRAVPRKGRFIMSASDAAIVHIIH